MIGSVKRKYPDRQPFGADGDGDLERSMLARQPRQRSGLCKTHACAIAGVTRSFREDHRAERRRRQQHHLPISEMWRELTSDIVLRESRGRAQDQLGSAHSLGNVCRYQRQLRGVPAVGVLDDNARARRAMLGYLNRIAPPQADIVSLQRKIARRRKRAIAAAEHHDLQDASPCVGS